MSQKCGSSSEISMPLWPRFSNLYGLAKTLDEASAALSYLMSPGNGWPSYLAMPGLGSKRSIWLGPPIMKREIIALALGGSGGVLGVRSNFCGPIGGWIGSASRPSSRKRHASASELKLKELARRKWRREQNELWLLDIKKAVGAEQGLAKAGQREGLRI